MAKEPAKAAEEQDSDMIEVSLAEATHQQLMWFSKEQGYETSDSETQNQTYSRIKAAWEHPTITVPRVIEEELVAPKPRRALPEGAAEFTKLPAKVKVKILSVGDENKTEEHLAHNGVAYRIQVGQVVELPGYVVQGCLLDALQLRYRSDTENGIGEPIVSQAIAFTIVE